VSLYHLVALAVTSFSLPLAIFSLFLIPDCQNLLLLWLSQDPFSESSLTYQSFSSLIFIWLGIVEPVRETFVFSEAHSLAHVLANFFLALNCYSNDANTVLFLNSANSFLSFVYTLHSNHLCQYTLRLSDLDVICFHMYDIIRLGVHSLYLVDDPIAQAIIPLHLPINEASVLAIEYLVEFQSRVQEFINGIPSPRYSSASTPLSRSLPSSLLDLSPHPSISITPTPISPSVSSQVVLPFSSFSNKPF
jgi:hypothetical protein